jgi:hypothetical protein
LVDKTDARLLSGDALAYCGGILHHMSEWNPERITYFATTHTRGQRRAFGIRAKDRDKHMYVIGKSGMGKSTMLENMAIQDIQNGEGMIFIDPHGSTAEKLLDFVPQERVKDMLYLAPFDTENPIGFNILEDVGYDNRHKVVAGLMGVFERIWADSWSARMQYILQNTLFALLEYPGATIIDVNRMLVNKAFRAEVVKHITDPVVNAFWNEEFANYGDRYTQEATPAIQNKIGQFVSNPLIRNILGQAKSTFDIRKMMDEKKIIIINLSKGRMGEANSTLLGSMLVIKIYLAALTRAEESAAVIAKLPPCFFYVDEFQNVVNKAFENILSEARKYKLCLTIANQYIEQMPEEVRNAVFGNVGTTVVFRVGPMDAQFLEPIFTPTFVPEDMAALGRGEIYLTLMIDGVGSAPFSAQTLLPIAEPEVSYKDDIITWTRHKYARPRAAIEDQIRALNQEWQDAAKNKHKEDSSRGQGSGGKPGGKPGSFSQGSSRPLPPRRDEGQSRSVFASEAPKTGLKDALVAAKPTGSEVVPAVQASTNPVRTAPIAPANTISSTPTPPARPTPSPVVLPPRPQKVERSPADILRTTQHKPVPTPAPPASPKDAQERNALKEAILKAQREREQQKKNPAPVVPPPRPVAALARDVPPKEVFDEVDPVLLRRLLHDDI